MSDWVETVRNQLVSRDVELLEGLPDERIAEIETELGFRFPADLRHLLSKFVPAGPEFPDWHSHQEQDLLDWLDRPAEELEYAVDQGFWSQSWGERPSDTEEAVDEARRKVSEAPVLIPVVEDYFLPAEPGGAGNPVFYVSADGFAVEAPDLKAFLFQMLEMRVDDAAEGVREIRFWSQLTAEMT